VVHGGCLRVVFVSQSHDNYMTQKCFMFVGFETKKEKKKIIVD
jgi:hypothetical protein